jgi:NhaA family Na+:H+ antiporter
MPRPLSSSVPLFALANAGVDLGSRGTVGSALGGRPAWAVIVGLLVGKTFEITVFTALGLRVRAGRLPAEVRLGHIVGAGALAGIGFTVSLFVTGLAFETPDLIADAKMGILSASVLAGALGTIVLLTLRRHPATFSGSGR